ncbi:MAG: hypothetical protein GQ535_08195 [Rhodobacteraceae bacterium]|nr:hypothetical protein [Paracoccaceae bacterium]
MDHDISFNNKRLQSRAKLAAWACWAMGLAIPGLLLLSWYTGDARVAALGALLFPPDHTLSIAQLAAAMALSLLPALALARALFGVAACFTGFAQSDWFGPRQPRSLAIAGRWLIIAGVLGLVVPTLLGLILTLNNAPGTRIFTFALSSNGVLTILFGTLLWALGHVWDMARGIAAENARFV